MWHCWVNVLWKFPEFLSTLTVAPHDGQTRYLINRRRQTFVVCLPYAWTQTIHQVQTSMKWGGARSRIKKRLFFKFGVKFWRNFYKLYIGIISCKCFSWCWNFFSWKRFSRLAFVRHYKSPFFADFLHVMDSGSSGKVDDLGPDKLVFGFTILRIMIIIIG